ncbi:MAG: class I SAM-dependent methyltransferase [Bacteroidetes bacterium]|nr:class I SAM-dependent methyltransferase [Bacteroidota bacterium]
MKSSHPSPSFHQIKSFVWHWLLEVDEHSIHSPFFFDLYVKTTSKKERRGIAQLEKLREDLLKNETQLQVEDFGTGQSGKRTIADIAAASLTPPEFASFYLELAHYMESQRVVELGTSLGLTSLYLAQKKEASVFTFEGCHDIANVALTNFEWSGKKNIKLIEGNIDQTLPKFLAEHARLDFVLMDANHRYGPTIRYYQMLTKRLWEKSVLIIDDIHRSDEMEKAWKEIRENIFVYGSIDLYRCGILFFDPALNKQHYVWSLK